jgi:hypothetical protein
VVELTTKEIEMEKSTHQGHCQVCGRKQMLPFDGRLSLHGYKVSGFGFFMGTCTGSRKLPLQQDRTITDEIITSLGVYAAAQDDFAVGLLSGTKFPATAWSGKHVKVVKTNRRGSWTVSEREYVKYADAPRDNQITAVRLAISAAQSEARHARSHAASLTRLAAAIHGTDLIPVVQEVKARSILKAGDVIVADGYRATTLVSPGYGGHGYRQSGGWQVKYEGSDRTYFTANAQLTRLLKKAGTTVNGKGAA